MGELDFYKHIYKEDNAFVIRYDGVSYGSYQDITDALYDRDLFMECEWDIGEALSRDKKPNKYKNMVLPPSRRYITIKRVGKYKYYTIRKVIDGEQRFFGDYKTFKNQDGDEITFMQLNLFK